MIMFATMPAGWWFPVFVVLSAAIIMRFERQRAKRSVERWAHEHNFVILKIYQPSVAPIWQSFGTYGYFRATLKDSTGIVRECWLHCLDFRLDTRQVEGHMGLSVAMPQPNTRQLQIFFAFFAQ